MSSTPVDPALSAFMAHAAHRKWAQIEDRTAATAPARAGLAAKWLREAGGDPVRAESLRKAHYARMTAASLAARAAKKAGAR